MGEMKILLRSGKQPFSVVSPERTLEANVLGTNSGNLIFAHAVHKSMYTEGTEIVSNHYKVDLNEAGRINEEYDAFVVPLANAWRPSFMTHLDRMSKLIERLDIPVVVVGVGVQASLDYSFERLGPHSRSVSRFVRAVLSRSASIGVRGDASQKYLETLGFSGPEVEIIGCPSMFLDGPNFRVNKGDPLTNESKIGINISPYVSEMEAVFQANAAIYPNMTYIPQNNDSLGQLLWADPGRPGMAIPHNPHHPFFVEDKVRFFVDPTVWIDYLRDFEFVFGSRIHGNVMPLLAGTPSMVLAHDSRTLELARYFEIPHRRVDELELDVTAAELFETADYTGLVSNHRERFETYVRFLEKNDLPHVYGPEGDQGAAFEEKLAQSQFPPPVRPATFASSGQLVQRIRWLRDRETATTKRLKKRVAALEKAVSEFTDIPEVEEQSVLASTVEALRGTVKSWRR